MNYPGYETIKRYYDLNCYTNADIKFFTEHGAITSEQYKQITGEDFPQGTD